ncbi:MAG: hypothetical protein EBU46_00025 [Nitrosomonadaceae bacterium]|nr:hypothetical protein [Nitrosomonadaceae bacterium]
MESTVNLPLADAATLRQLAADTQMLKASSHGEDGDYIVGRYNEHGGKITKGRTIGGADVAIGIASAIASHAAHYGQYAPIVHPVPQPAQPASQPVATTAKQRKDKQTTKKKDKVNDTRKQTVAKEPASQPQQQQPQQETLGMQLRSDDFEPQPLHEFKSTGQLVKAAIKANQQTTKIVSFLTELGKIKLNVVDYLRNEHAVCLIFSDDSMMTVTPKPGTELKLQLPNGEELDVVYLDLVFKWLDDVTTLMVLLLKPNER